MNTSTSMNTQHIYERVDEGHRNPGQFVRPHDHSVRHMFVYGSLRPDDTSGQDWTKDFVRGFSIVARAQVRNAKMYRDGYASVTLDSPSRTARVSGFVLGLPGATNTKAWNHKVQWADDMTMTRSGDSQLGYERVIVNATVFTPEQGLHEVKAFIYHRPNCARNSIIISGDWLLRDVDPIPLYPAHQLQDPF